MIKLQCQMCKKIFLEKPYRAEKAKFCSLKCFGFSIKGVVPKSAFKKGHHASSATEFKPKELHPYFGKTSNALGKHWKLSEETKAKMKIAQTRTRKPNPDVPYCSLHKWIKRKLGNPIKCEFCDKKFTKSHSLHWANKSGEYKRELSDWISLCPSCHWKYDK